MPKLVVAAESASIFDTTLTQERTNMNTLIVYYGSRAARDAFLEENKKSLERATFDIIYAHRSDLNGIVLETIPA